MRTIKLTIALLLGLWSLAGFSADLPLKEKDCARILERWAENPASVPKHLVDACKDQMAEAPAAAAAATPLAAAEDPCSGPNAADSVLCWGPWGELAPAAAAPLATMEFPDDPGDCRSGSGIADQCVPRLDPLITPPLEGCAPGTPCGFATIVDGLTSTGDVDQTEFRRFDLAPDGSRFTVDPNGNDEIESAEMGVNIAPRTDGYENMRSRNTDPSADHQSRLIARIVRDDEESPIRLAADVWTDGSRSNSALNRSGYFAWGIATSQSGLNLLNGEGVSVSFSGPMSVNNATTANMTVNFGSQPNWTGNWTNPNWSFGAGGSVTGVNLISSPTQFTSNVQAGSFVQGALVGEPGQMGLTHIIDVTLADQGHIKDVGLLREVISPPTVSVGP